MIIARTSTTAVIRAIIHGFNELVLLPSIDGLLRESCILKTNRN